MFGQFDGLYSIDFGWFSLFVLNAKKVYFMDDAKFDKKSNVMSNEKITKGCASCTKIAKYC